MKLESLMSSKFEAFKGSELHDIFKINGGLTITELKNGKKYEGDKWINGSHGGTQNHLDEDTPDPDDYGDLYYPREDGYWGLVG